MGTVKITSRYGILLGFIALLCTIISAGIYFLTKDKIDAVIAAQQRELLLQVIPQDYFNNNLLESAVIPQDKNFVGIQKFILRKKMEIFLPMPMKPPHQMVTLVIFACLWD